MGKLLRRLLPANRKITPQVALVGLVILAALVSALFPQRRVVPSTESAAAIDAISQQPPSASPPVVEEASPLQPVEDAFEAAHKGDLDTYLAQFAEPLKTELARIRTEKGDAYLRDYLVCLTGPLKGISADLNHKASLGQDTLSLPVEFIYADHNEQQVYRIRRVGGQWRISQVASVRAAPTLIPYGTPIQNVGTLSR